MSRARKVKPATIPPGRFDVHDPDYHEAFAKARHFGCSEGTAHIRAAQRIVHREAMRMGHTPCQQGDATECAKCGAYGTVNAASATIGDLVFSRPEMLTRECGI